MKNQHGIRLDQAATGANPKLAQDSIGLEMTLVHCAELVEPNGLTGPNFSPTAKSRPAERQHIDLGFLSLANRQAHRFAPDKGSLDPAGF